MVGKNTNSITRVITLNDRYYKSLVIHLNIIVNDSEQLYTEPLNLTLNFLMAFVLHSNKLIATSTSEKILCLSLR